MMTDRESISEGGTRLSQEPTEMQEPAWVLAKSLLEVNETCTNTLEHFLLYSATNRLDDLPADKLSTQLESLIERQRRTVTELELAKDALDELASQ